jgi:hypothetical protein
VVCRSGQDENVCSCHAAAAVCLSACLNIASYLHCTSLLMPRVYVVVNHLCFQHRQCRTDAAEAKGGWLPHTHVASVGVYNASAASTRGISSGIQCKTTKSGPLVHCKTHCGCRRLSVAKWALLATLWQCWQLKRCRAFQPPLLCS